MDQKHQCRPTHVQDLQPESISQEWNVCLEHVFRKVPSNIRIADQRIGDIKAQAAALTVGEKRFTELLDRYGAETVQSSIKELKNRAAKQMRARIKEIPDGLSSLVHAIDQK